MDAKEATDKLNRIIHGEKIEFPRYLYKYRPFDEHVWDMLENDYLFLCPPKDLDDPSECQATLTFKDLYDWETNRLKKKCVEGIIAYIKPYMGPEDFKKVNEILDKSLYADGRVKTHFLLDAHIAMQELVSDEILISVINWLANIPNQLDDPEIIKRIEEVFVSAICARESLGVCSLSAEQDLQDMWTKYAENSTGYCIKFDLDGYCGVRFLHPVVYADTRNTNIADNFIISFIGELIYKISVGQIVTDRTAFMKMFLTKDTKWEYQNEWRLLGDAKQHMKAPKIDAIYLGEYVSADNRKKMKEFCQNKNINLIEK